MRIRRIIILLATFTFFLLLSCTGENVIKIGMIAGLTGRVADLGIAGRDGVILAVEETNSTGGIAGKYVELVIKDDKQDAVVCQFVLSEMAKEGVSGIVGPMTSSMGMIVAQHINKHGIPTISPTVSTTELSGVDDYFFRIIPDISNAAVKTAEYAFTKKNYRRAVVIYDKGNRAFTEPWYQQFATQFSKLGGDDVANIAYASTNNFNFLALTQEIAFQKYDCLIIIANALDTAMISQQLRKQEITIPIIASEWAATDDITEFGGNAVEGIEILHSFDGNNQSTAYRSFAERFEKRFGYSVSFAAAYAYNAANILMAAVASENAPEKIKNAILSGSPYDGVQNKVKFNQYGDVSREYTLLKIRGNRLVSN